MYIYQPLNLITHTLEYRVGVEWGMFCLGQGQGHIKVKVTGGFLL